MIGFEPETIIKRLRYTIKNGKYGVDYTISRREKNNRLREEYLIDDAKITYILNELSVEDYVKSENSINEDYLDDVVHVFEKVVPLIRRYRGIEVTDVRLYIKLTWTKIDKRKMIIISFHEAEY